MGGRDHACEVCGRGGFNNDEECVCPPDPVSPGDERVTLYRSRSGALYTGQASSDTAEEWVPASRLEAVEAERDKARATIHRMDTANIAALRSHDSFTGGVVESIHALAARAERAEEALAEFREAANGYLAGQNFGGYKDGNYGHDEGCREARAALCGVLYPLNEAAEALLPSQPKEKER